MVINKVTFSTSESTATENWANWSSKSESKSCAAERNFCLACLKISFVVKHFIVTLKCQLFESQKCASPARQHTRNRLEMEVLTAN